ncbi:PseG/SpsG family protein [Knoellia sp. CPCC 206435]|uniref:PseG/SpsG family protein n=1 Tax=Knoellia terrae TaxID=3404797 RepID=UPI003B42FCA0
MSQPHIGIRADASPLLGVGHVVRCLALAEELAGRGCTVTLLGSVDVPWLRDRLAAVPLPVVPAPDDAGSLVSLAQELGMQVLVVDGYELDPATGSRARAGGLTVLALHDGSFGAGQDADVYLDQNFGATSHPAGTDGRVALAGVEHALFRREILELATQPRREPGRASVVGVFGGTDPQGAAAVVTPLVLATGVPVDVTCVVARPELREVVEGLPHGESQTVTAVAPTPDIMGLASRSTVTVSAAGSSIWELLHLGVPTGIVAVVDNQEQAYADVTSRGVAAAVGVLDELRSSEAARTRSTEVLHRLLTDPDRRRGLGDNARRLVDGQGRRRVADALLAAVGRR